MNILWKVKSYPQWMSLAETSSKKDPPKREILLWNSTCLTRQIKEGPKMAKIIQYTDIEEVI